MLQTNASIIGLGACLLQEEKPVYFVCKALTDAQQAYIAIELESVAVPWGNEEMSSFPIFKPLHFGNGSEALRSNFIQGL